MFKRKKKLPINREYLNKYRNISRCKDEDIIEHRMLHDHMFYNVSIDKGWRCYATLTMHDGKRFIATWALFGLRELKEVYINALRYHYRRNNTKSEDGVSNVK